MTDKNTVCEMCGETVGEVLRLDACEGCRENQADHHAAADHALGDVSYCPMCEDGIPVGLGLA